MFFPSPIAPPLPPPLSHLHSSLPLPPIVPPPLPPPPLLLHLISSPFSSPPLPPPLLPAPLPLLPIPLSPPLLLFLFSSSHGLYHTCLTLSKKNSVENVTPVWNSVRERKKVKIECLISV